MKYLIDTDCTIDFLKGRQAGIDLLRGLAPDGIGISLITYGEIYEGIYAGRDSSRHETAFREFLRLADVVSLNRSTMKLFGALRGDLRRRGLLIGDPDVIIAASAIFNKLILVTRNRRHFERIPQVELLDIPGG